MIVVWLLNNPVSISSRLLYNTNSQSGGWIDATFDSIKHQIDSSEIELHIIAPVEKEHDDIEYCKGCVCHYVKWRKNGIGIEPQKKDVIRLKRLLQLINPDLVMAWGTEFTFNYSGITCSKQLHKPSLVYIQGLANSFVGYENAHLTYRDMTKQLGVFDKLKTIYTKQYYHSLKKQTYYEGQMINACDGIISDNRWCFEIGKSINPNVKCFYSLLPLSDNFTQSKSWSIETMKRHQIFTIAGRTAYKGLHILIDAIKLVKMEYPDVRLDIPGYMGYGKPKFLKKPPYVSYLERIIKDNNLSDNVRFVGRLSSGEMATMMQTAHCFVMPSCIENHSSTLREALYVGVPCISAMVGSIYELIESNTQALLYRYEDAFALATMIKKTFASDELCKTLSENGHNRVTSFYGSTLNKSIGEIYESVLEQ